MNYIRPLIRLPWFRQTIKQERQSVNQVTQVATGHLNSISAINDLQDQNRSIPQTLTLINNQTSRFEETMQESIEVHGAHVRATQIKLDVLSKTVDQFANLLQEPDRSEELKKLQAEAIKLRTETGEKEEYLISLQKKNDELKNAHEKMDRKLARLHEKNQTLKMQLAQKNANQNS